MKRLPQPGPIALEAVAVAEGQVGIAELGGNNRGPEVESYLASVGMGPGAPWCASFIRFCIERAAAHLAHGMIPIDFPDSAWCPAYEAWAKREGLWFSVSDAKAFELVIRGDLALFWFRAKGRIAHIGFVTGYPSNGTGIASVEGNTGPDHGVNRDGDGVYRKTRPWGALGERGGFVRLPW